MLFGFGQMRTGPKGYAIIKEFEGLHKKRKDGKIEAYLDKLVRPALRSPGYKGLWTIGYGSTGPNITAGTVWTVAQCIADLERRVKYEHEAALNKKCKALGIKLDQNQFDALISASWNLGTESTLIHRVLALVAEGKEDNASALFVRYNKAGGKVRAGLTRRRKAEAKLFDTYTKQQLVQASTKLGLMSRAKKGMLGTGVVGLLTWDNFLQVKSVVSDNIGIILLVAGFILWMIFNSLENRSVKDYEEERWKPSKLSET